MSSLLLTLLGLVAASVVQPAVTRAAAPADPPALVVVLVVDGLSSALLERAQPLFSEGGFRRLFREGAHAARALLPHSVTSRAPGRAAIATGMLPGRAGVPGDLWFDRAGRQSVLAVSDARATTVGSDPRIDVRGRSAGQLELPTLGAAFRQRFGPGCVVQALGWRAEVLLLAGPTADGAFWIDGSTGTWVGSSRHVSRLPPWLVELNEQGGLAVHRGQIWERLFDEETGRSHAGPDDDAREQPRAGGTTFPYGVPEWSESAKRLRLAVQGTPFADRSVLGAVDAALRVQGGAGLGRDDVPDLLLVALDALADAGADYGPESQEALDLVLRVDLALGELLGLLDERVGSGRWSLALCAGQGMPARPDAGTGSLVGALDMLVPAERLLREAHPQHVVSDGRAFTLGLAGPWLHLSHEVARRAGSEPAVAARLVADGLQQLPAVSRALTRADLLASEGGLLAQWGRELHAERSGDVLLLLEPGAVFNTQSGRAFAGDRIEERRVPLAFLGQGIAPGCLPADTSILDLAPTLAALVGAPLTKSDGRALQGALVDDS
ncbi:MAG: hypothetical protein DRQ55_12350 [Planctomycetota bacterium]|nr:MAG: hypothetical protein DRQ55_12350 [Planctomycetota bacterium]